MNRSILGYNLLILFSILFFNFSPKSPFINLGYGAILNTKTSRAEKISSDLATCLAPKYASPEIQINPQLARFKVVTDNIAQTNRNQLLERKPQLQPLLTKIEIEADSPTQTVLSLIIDPKNPSRVLTLETRRREGTYEDEVLLVEYFMNVSTPKGKLLQTWILAEANQAVGLSSEEAIKLGLENPPHVKGQKPPHSASFLNSKLIVTSTGQIGVAFGSSGLLISPDGGKSLSNIRGLRKTQVISYHVDPSSKQKLLVGSEISSTGKRIFTLTQLNQKKSHRIVLPSFYSPAPDYPDFDNQINGVTSQPNVVRSHPKKSNIVYIGTGKRVYECRTFPNCTSNSWSEMKDGMNWDSNVYDISFDGEKMYAATCNGVYVKNLNQSAWKKIIAPDVFNSGITPSQFQQRRDYGINSDYYLRSETITVNSKNQKQMAIASEGRVFYSNNSGLSWRRLPIPDGTDGARPNSFHYQQTQFLADGSLIIGGNAPHGAKNGPLYRVMP